MILVAFAGCDGEDDDCDPNLLYLSVHSEDTGWVEYVDSDTYVVGDHGIAVGGSERYHAAVVNDCGGSPPPEPVTVLGADPTVATVAVSGPAIDVHGVDAGSVMLQLETRDAMTERTIDVKPIDAVRLVSDELGEPGAFYAGRAQAKVQLLAEQDWVVDRDLTVAGDIPQGSAWNVLDLRGASVGDHAVTIIAGTSSWPVTATIVDHIDEVIPQARVIAASPYGDQDVCFFARVHGVVVAGVPMTFDFDPEGGELGRPNCVAVWQRDGDEISTTVTAHALGFSTTSTVTFGS